MSFDPLRMMDNQNPVQSPDAWFANYKEAFLEHEHDLSQLTLALPDDQLVVMGPPRLSMATRDNDFHIVGFLNQLQYTETRNVQPLKGLGSRRHIFAATNTPVQGSIARLMFLGRNLINSLYTEVSLPDSITDRNSKYDDGEEGTWWRNLEEDVFRIPFGMGVIYGSPASMAANTGTMAGAEYLEVCVLTNRSVSSVSGQAMIMEQCSFMADRVVPWDAYDSISIFDVPDPMQGVGVY